MMSFLYGIETLMKWANDHGLWGIITIITGLIIWLSYLWAKRRVRNLNFYNKLKRDNSQNYPLVILIEIRNYTGRSVVISSPYFNYDKLRPHQHARGDSPSGDYEIKFPGPNGNELSEVEYLLRNKENVSTYIPIDPAHTDQEVTESLQKHRVGKFTCVCTWLEEKPRTHKLKFSI